MDADHCGHPSPHNKNTTTHSNSTKHGATSRSGHLEQLSPFAHALSGHRRLSRRRVGKVSPFMPPWIQPVSHRRYSNTQYTTRKSSADIACVEPIALGSVLAKNVLHICLLRLAHMFPSVTSSLFCLFEVIAAQVFFL